MDEVVSGWLFGGWRRGADSYRPELSELSGVFFRFWVNGWNGESGAAVMCWRPACGWR